MTTIVVRFVGKSVSPKTISGALGGQPHESCLWGDMIDVTEDDGTVARKRSLAGFWRRTVEVDRYASVSDALADLLGGLTRDPAKWIQFTSVHRSGIAVCDPPSGSTPTSLFSGDELELFASLGLRVDLYFLSERSLKNTQDASDKPPL